MPSGGHRRRARHDEAELRAANVTKGTLKRIWRFLGRYRLRLVLYLLSILAFAVVGSIPPLLVAALIDHGIKGHNSHLVDMLALAMVGRALAQTALSLLNRWFGSVIGEGIIYDR